MEPATGENHRKWNQCCLSCLETHIFIGLRDGTSECRYMGTWNTLNSILSLDVDSKPGAWRRVQDVLRWKGVLTLDGGELNGKHPLSRDAPFDSAITVFWEYSSHDINHANTIKPLRSFPQGQHYSNLCSCKHRAYQNDQSSSGFLWLTQTCKSPVSRPVSLGWSVMVTLRLSLTFIYANVWHVELWRMS